MAAERKIFCDERLPHNLEAEKVVLGSMLLSKEALNAATEELRREDFYYEINGNIFFAVSELNRSGKPVDFVTVTNLMEKDGIETYGGYEYISEIQLRVPSAANYAEYIGIVREKSKLRRLMEAAAEMLEKCASGDAPADSVAAEAERSIINATQTRSGSFATMLEALDDAMERTEAMHSDPNGIPGLRTGITSLDRLTGGLLGGELILLAARPSMGKTALALNIASGCSRINSCGPIALFSMEMPKRDLAMRMLSCTGHIPMANLRSGRLAGRDWDKLQNAANALSTTDLRIDDGGNATITSIRSMCRRLKLEKGLGLVVIDYLQLITGEKNGMNREREIGDMTRSLKLMARELDVPVLLLSQLSRAPEKREDHRPLLADLRDSGSIEQDADKVLFIYRDSYYRGEEDMKKNEVLTAELILAKNRNGATGTACVIWNAAEASFYDREAAH